MFVSRCQVPRSHPGRRCREVYIMSLQMTLCRGSLHQLYETWSPDLYEQSMLSSMKQSMLSSMKQRMLSLQTRHAQSTKLHKGNARRWPQGAELTMLCIALAALFHMKLTSIVSITMQSLFPQWCTGVLRTVGAR